MIKTWKHKSLKTFWQTGGTKGIISQQAYKLALILQAIDMAQSISDLKVLGFGLHQLKGDRKDTWSIKVSGNWRITFRFAKGDCYEIDYEDYH